jgi:hypothetical protein
MGKILWLKSHYEKVIDSNEGNSKLDIDDMSVKGLS